MAEVPLISVVLPVRGVRRFLPDCLDSVLGQADDAIEVIAIDDASADGCAELLDERAASDGRLRVIHLEQAGGPGPARNHGLAAASGEYVWFVDGDDLIAPGSLMAIRDRVAAVQPDLLLIDYQELNPDGSTRPSPGRELLSAAPSASFTLAGRPELINRTMTAWSKVFRREFLAGLGVPFAPGIHEDVAVTCAALLAGRLAVLDRVCYRYRRYRPGSFLVTPGAGHLAVFAAYRQVFEILAGHCAAGDPVATGAVQAAVFERAIWHYGTVLQARSPGRRPGGRRSLVPRQERRRFFHRMHAEFTARRPPGYQLPGGARGAKFRLVERDAYLAYRVLEPLNEARVAIRRRLRPGPARRP